MILKTLLFVGIATVGIVLVAAAFRPDQFRVQRSVTIAAGADRIHALINDMHAFNSWNPFNKKDPQMRGSYRGPAAGPGAAYDFAGNSQVGAGTVAIVDSAPQRITMKLDMREPMAASNTVVFSIVPRGNASEVTWAMHGNTPYLGKLLHMVFDMDKMVGGTFEAGLADLKQLAEKKA
jgi:hypothetical protein